MTFFFFKDWLLPNGEKLTPLFFKKAGAQVFTPSPKPPESFAYPRNEAC
jgi:hypothetical protein